MTGLSQHDLESLAFIKYLWGQAVEQAARAEPFCGSAVLGFHDCVELFVELAAIHLGAPNKAKDLLEYWNIQLPGGGTFGHRKSIERLNKVRVALKHAGVFPRKQEVEDLRTRVAAFLEDSTSLVFGIEFSAVSMVHLVQHVPIQETLSNSESLAASGDLIAAVDQVSIAFQKLMVHFDSNRDVLFRYRFPHHSASDIRFHASAWSQFTSRDTPRIIEGVGRVVDRLADEIDAIYEILKIMVLGVDYKRHSKFLRLTPFVSTHSLGPPENIGYQVHRRELTAYTPDDFHFCLNYVVECAVQIQDLLGPNPTGGRGPRRA